MSVLEVLADLNDNELGLRNQILWRGDVPDVVDLCNDVTNSTNDRLNETGWDVSDSLLARAFIARALLLVAAQWMADIAKCPTPVAWRVLMSLVTDPPADLVSDVLKADRG